MAEFHSNDCSRAKLLTWWQPVMGGEREKEKAMVKYSLKDMTSFNYKTYLEVSIISRWHHQVLYLYHHYFNDDVKVNIICTFLNGCIHQQETKPSTHKPVGKVILDEHQLSLIFREICYHCHLSFIQIKLF